MSTSPRLKTQDTKARDAEYQALWQACDRASRKQEYLCSHHEAKRIILESACHGILDKRRGQGKIMCGTSIVSMVHLHLQRDVNSRLLAEARMSRFPSPPPNDMPCLANPVANAGNPVGYNDIPQQQQQPQRVSPMISAAEMALRNEVTSLRQDVSLLRQEHELVVSSLQILTERVAKLEGRQAVLEAYPNQGIEGRNAWMLVKPMSPRSQTQGRDEDMVNKAADF
ncbi:hypothetical protein F66182_10980 [Fusarium sp. NRRL 66182]|nr:hypothetical protein F66182_10980 [Fusarium sp. NRRL 66182]